MNVKDLYIMSDNTVVAKWINNEFEVLNKALCPLYLLNTGNVEHWLEMRAIDYHRANSRLLKKALRLAERDDISTVISVNAVTITDNYWVKSPESDLTYDDVRFDNDYFSTLALTGSYDSFNRAASGKSSRTPELTNIGSFEKCWRLIDGEWWMYKAADLKQQFSEIFTYELGKALGFNMALYERDNKCVKSKDFTNGASVNFEPAYSFMGDNEDYIDVLKALKDIAPHAIPDFVEMVFLDTIVANPDRHTFNFGLLRDTKTGEIIAFAPNFDNNMALISRGYPSNIKRENDVYVKFFKELIDYDNSLAEYIPTLDEKTVRDIIDKIGIRVRKQLVINFVMNGYRQIVDSLSE
jgi:hypothetical protein